MDVVLTNTCEVPAWMPPLPRVGLTLTLPASLSRVAYFGHGPPPLPRSHGVRPTAKAYQLNPAKVNETLLQQILIKALTRLAEPQPAHDFVLLSTLLPEALHASPSFALLQRLKTNLDRAEFPQFWEGVESARSLFDSTPGAVDAFRGYVATVLERCFQRIPMAVLVAALGIAESALATFIASRSGCGWTVGKFPTAVDGVAAETCTSGEACVIFPVTSSNQPVAVKFQSTFELSDLSGLICQLSK